MRRRILVALVILVALAAFWGVWKMILDPTSAIHIRNAELRKAARHFRELNLVIMRREALVKEAVKSQLEGIGDAVQNESWQEAHELTEGARKIKQGGRAIGLETPEQYAKYLAARTEKRRFWSEQASLHSPYWANYADCLSDPGYLGCDDLEKAVQEKGTQ